MCITSKPLRALQAVRKEPNLLYAMPEVVRTEKTEDWEATDQPHLTLFGMCHYTKSGVIGFPSKATAEKGRLLMEKLTDLLGQDIAGFLAQA